MISAHVLDYSLSLVEGELHFISWLWKQKQTNKHCRCGGQHGGKHQRPLAAKSATIEEGRGAAGLFK